MTERKKKMFLKHYSDEMSISKACEKAGIDRSTYYNWIEKDSDFKSSVQDTKKVIFDIAQSVLIKAMSETKETKGGKEKIPTMSAIKVALFMYKELSIKEEDSSEDVGYEIIES